MTFFNKKTEVMQIEMTPYGRYLYSIGKFKPHSYEFVDDDINYKVSGEAQEDAHNRILNETPKLKINRAFQDEAPQIESPPNINIKRVMVKKMDHKQNGLSALGRSSYSAENSPEFQVTMLRGSIKDSTLAYDFISSPSSSIDIPQVTIQMNFTARPASIINPLPDFDGKIFTSPELENGEYVEIQYREPIIHLKEFNSFYEKENFEMEIFKINNTNNEILIPLRIEKEMSKIVDDILVESRNELSQETELGMFEQQIDERYSEFYFEIELDEQIPQEILCEAISEIEINSQFLDEEIICPDRRTDRFDIYATRVGPEDLEDCD